MSTILHWNRVKTRRPHKCWGCNQKYPAGSTMFSAAYADNGTAWSVYWCKTCQEYMRQIFRAGDEVEQGGIRAYNNDEWERIHKEVLDENSRI